MCVTSNNPMSATLIDDDLIPSSYDAPYTLRSRYGRGESDTTDISEYSHLRQSIIDILTTPLGSRVLLREYGSELCQLIDTPVNTVFFIKAYKAILISLRRWEPRYVVTKATIVSYEDGVIEIDLYGYYLLEGRGVTLRNVTLDFKKDLDGAQSL